MATRNMQNIYLGQQFWKFWILNFEGSQSSDFLLQCPLENKLSLTFKILSATYWYMATMCNVCRFMPVLSDSRTIRRSTNDLTYSTEVQANLQW